MKYFLSFLLLLCAGGLIAFDHFNVSYWMLAPEKRVDMKWAYEVEKVEAKSPEIKTALLLLKDWKMATTDQQFKVLIDKSHAPFRKATKGGYTMEIQIMPWIEDMKYGYMIQHELFDSQNNKIKEFTVNFDIGYLW
jgi:hypothetical protein